MVLKNYAKKFPTEEEFFYAYGRAIGWKQSKHEEILGLYDKSKKIKEIINLIDDKKIKDKLEELL